MKRISHSLFTVICVLFTLYALLHPFEITMHCKNALSMCASAVLPPLFIYIVISRMLSHVAVKSAPGGKAVLNLSKIFRLSPALIPVIFSSLLMGAPSGALMCAEIYKKGLCSKDDAERCACLTNNCSPAFILAVAGGYVAEKRYAVLILVSNILAVFTVYFLVNRGRQKTKHDILIPYEKQEHTSVFSAICSAISGAVISSLRLCGYVTVFYVISRVISARAGIMFSHVFNKAAVASLTSILCGFFEMTSGVLSAGENVLGTEKIVIICMTVGFCGLSVIMQTADVLSSASLSAKKFILQKFLCALVCPLYMIFFLLVVPSELLVFSPDNAKGFGLYDLAFFLISLLLAVSGVKILRRIDKRHKNTR